MKFMLSLCCVWMVVSTTMILFHAPVSVTRHDHYGSHDITEEIEYIGPFGAPFYFSGSPVTRSSIDFSRLIAALLAVNFLPAVILWRSEVIGEWLRRHKRKLVISACALVVLFLLWLGGVMFYEKAYRVPPTRSSPDKQSSVSSASPSPASSSPASPSPAPPAAPASRSPSSAIDPNDITILYSPAPPSGLASPSLIYSPGGGQIKSTSADGELIILEDGSVWRVDPPDRINTASWTRMTYLDVVISEVGYRDRKRGYLLINMTKGEKAYAGLVTLPPNDASFEVRTPK
jgi:hypothetical protein